MQSIEKQMLAKIKKTSRGVLLFAEFSGFLLRRMLRPPGILTPLESGDIARTRVSTRPGGFHPKEV